MNIEQLSIFDMPVITTKTKREPKQKIVKRQNEVQAVQDIRTDGQTNRETAFDVGEKIGGARKDIAQRKQEFLQNPSLTLLKELESTDVGTAAEVIVRDTFFSWFSFEDCRKRKVEPGAAKAIQLFINRIPKVSFDSPEARTKYVNMLTFLRDILRTVVTEADYSLFESRVNEVFRTDGGTEYIEKYIRENEESLVTEIDQEKIKGLEFKIQMDKAFLFMNAMGKTMAFREYNGPLRNYFLKHQSRVGLLRTAFAVNSYDELIPTGEKKVAATNRGTRKPVWERVMPEKPQRIGGKEIIINNPKQFVSHFGFRSAEFGHYVGDEKGEEHLSRSAEAYTDLADILQIPTKAVSLKNELAMAFGSRGSGRALGHYEPSRKVINLTKEKGSLGILAHEWFHSLDHYLFNYSHSFNNGKPGFLSNLEFGTIPEEVINKLKELMNVIKNGKSTAYIEVKDCTRSYRVNNHFTNLFDLAGEDLQSFMDLSIKRFDEHASRMMEGIVSDRYREAQKIKYAKQRVRDIKKNAEAVAEYYFKLTGKKVDKVPYTSDRSVFYQHSINMDKGKVGKYWSSNVELAARAFESYIFDELQERKWTSDYLVCGIRDSVFPDGKERVAVFNAMKAFIEAIRPYLLK